MDSLSGLELLVLAVPGAAFAWLVVDSWRSRVGGDISNAILEALEEGPASGLELTLRIERKYGRGIVHQGNVYPALRRLEAADLIYRYQEPGGLARGGRPRSLYELRDDTAMPETLR